jgi:hypothetical protein
MSRIFGTFMVGTKNVHGVRNHWPIARNRVCRSDVWQSEQSESVPTDLFGNNLALNPSLICCYKVLQMVGHLHARWLPTTADISLGRGYEMGIRIYTGATVRPDNGACMKTNPNMNVAD